MAKPARRQALTTPIPAPPRGRSTQPRFAVGWRRSAALGGSTEKLFGPSQVGLSVRHAFDLIDDDEFAGQFVPGKVGPGVGLQFIQRQRIGTHGLDDCDNAFTPAIVGAANDDGVSDFWVR